MNALFELPNGKCNPHRINPRAAAAALETPAQRT